MNIAINVAISAVGILKSTDGGRSWSFRNKRLLADFLPNKFPEYGQCPHKLVRHPARPDVIYQQNHCGVYRSDDNAETWVDISAGVSSRFGFPIAVDSSARRGSSWHPRSLARPDFRLATGSWCGSRTTRGRAGRRQAPVSPSAPTIPSTGRV
jgi:hypothetical protein